MVWVFTYTDCEGNAHDWTYTYTINMPDFTLPADGASTVDCPADALVQPTTPVMMAACRNTITPVATPTPPALESVGDMVWVFTYTDCEGNAHDWTYTYTINMPDFTLPADGASTVDCPADALVQPTTPVMLDAYGNTITPVATTTLTEIECVGDMVRVFTSTSSEFNYNDSTYTYTINMPDFT